MQLACVHFEPELHGDSRVLQPVEESRRHTRLIRQQCPPHHTRICSEPGQVLYLLYRFLGTQNLIAYPFKLRV